MSKKIDFLAVNRCYLGPNVIHHCNELESVKWPSIFNFEHNSVFDNCAKLGNMIVYRRLLTCQDNNDFYVVDSDILEINNRAFVSCYNMKFIYVPKNVDIIDRNAFLDSNITV